MELVLGTSQILGRLMGLIENDLVAAGVLQKVAKATHHSFFFLFFYCPTNPKKLSRLRQDAFRTATGVHAAADRIKALRTGDRDWRKRLQ